MLTHLHVKNFAVVKDVEVDFGDNLNILTGETGAGKSVIIGSVNIALGGRVSSDMIRSGEDYAYVEMVFEPSEDLVKELNAIDIYPENNMLVISRRIMPGKSVSKVNGETVTAGALKAISSLLIDMYGQHEHQSLLNSSKHLDIIDRYAGAEQLKNEVGRLYAEYIKVKKEWDGIQVSDEERVRELSFTEYEISEIENAGIHDGEEEELETKYRKLVSSEKIIKAAADVYDLTGNGDMTASSLIGRAVSILNEVVEYDSKISDYMQVLLDAESILSDFNREMSSYMDDFVFDEQAFNEIQDRLEYIRKIFAKYGGSYENMSEYYNKLTSRRNELLELDETKARIKERLTNIEAELYKLSAELSKLRKDKAAFLKERISEALSDLNFSDVRFDIVFTNKDDYDACGTDKAEFMISTNPGEDIKPLSLVASGGELSRIMLGIKSVLCDNDSIYTLVFDEIDAGISGRTAQKVSEKLARIAANHQVICITHLAQIAAMADRHFVIEKNVSGNRTHTEIRRLSDEETTGELARILGGTEITESVLSNANEMKELAKSWKSECIQ